MFFFVDLYECGRNFLSYLRSNGLSLFTTTIKYAKVISVFIRSSHRATYIKRLSLKKNRNCFFSYCCRNFPCYLHINRLSFLPVVSSSGVAYSIPSLVHESPGYGDCTLTTSSTRQSQSAPHLHRVVEGCYGYNGRTQVRVA